ncbi:MAG: elongation factor P [Candidatus Omnitrophota bacterium]|jgi:elongation factor P
MISGMDVHEGMLLSIDKRIYKVISAELRGSAQAHKIMHAGLKSVPEGNYIEKKYGPGEKVEQIIPDRFDMEYLYNDGNGYYFMNNQSFEQFTVPKNIVGNAGLYLKEKSIIQVEFYNGQPINIIFPKTVELKVISAPPGIHDGTDTTLKEVTLENNQRVLGPQFLKEGDMVRVDVESGKYMERIKK